MLLQNGSHLTYCSNIHPGESWEKHLEQLENHLPAIKKLVSPEEKCGIGLRLSAMASETLGEKASMEAFREFLYNNNLYVFTMNGFPYGSFHHSRVKDDVHQPDWQTQDRLNYSKRLFAILKNLVPEGMDGGVSTSPLSYKPWFTTEQQFENAVDAALDNLIEIVTYLYRIREEHGVFLHLDIEPEPDGVIQNSEEFVFFYNNWLLKRGTSRVAKLLGVSQQRAEEAIRQHIQLCYDVCHFALVYEDVAEVFDRLKAEAIGIGKIQLSAALRTMTGAGNLSGREELRQFNEDIYLHQVITRDKQGLIKSYRDLPEAFVDCPESFEGEWRVHFHVPLFVEEYGHLSSTQKDVKKTLQLVKDRNMKIHLEVETYTWGVLPEALKLDIDASIARELQWVKGELVT